MKSPGEVIYDSLHRGDDSLPFVRLSEKEKVAFDRAARDCQNHCFGQLFGFVLMIVVAAICYALLYATLSFFYVNTF